MRYTALAVHDQAEACRLLAAAQSAKTDAARRFSLAGLVARGAAYQVFNQRGDVVAAFLVEASNGALWVTAAAGRAPDNLVAILSGFVEHQARECRLSGVGFRTERRGLVRKARAIGYQVTRQEGNEYFMRKTLQ